MNQLSPDRVHMAAVAVLVLVPFLTLEVFA